MQHQDIVFTKPGQRLVFDPPEGRPSSPSVRVIDGPLIAAATIGPCTVDPVDTALHGDAFAGGTSIRVADITGIVPGGRYLMTKPAGDREWIVVSAIRGDTLVLDRPLIHRYAANARIVGCRISVAIDDGWAASPANLSERRGGLAGYLVRWSYTIDGFEMTAVSFADLVSCPTKELVTPEDVHRRFSGYPLTGTDYISEAVRAIRLEAVGDAHAQRKIRDTRILRELINARAEVIRLEQDVMHGGPRSGELAVAERRYRSIYARLVALPKAVEPPPDPEPPRPKHKTTEPGTPRRIPKLTKH